MGQSLRRLAAQTRSIHIPRRLPLPSNPTNPIRQALTFITSSLVHSQGPSAARSAHSSPSIRQSLSLPARIALSRPLRAPCLPRASRVPGNVTHVGLGTARNFSSGRPIFQHLVENVPVTGRAFHEVDWDLKTRQEENHNVRRTKKAARKAKLADKLTANYENIPPSASSVKENEEWDHYFQAPFVQRITTYLQIPLAPTPSARVPLSSPPPSPHLLPLSALAKDHASHSKHAIRVSCLFRRLDAAKVWGRGASCETLGDPSGLCTILRIKFDGWTKSMVKDVLGDAGKDWCTVQEFQHALEDCCTLEDSLTSTFPRALSPEPIASMATDVSFVMPTLDFSSSFVSVHSASTSWPGTPASPMSLSDVESDYSFPSTPQSAPDGESESEVSTVDSSVSSSSVPKTSSSSASSSAWLSFSADFATRASNQQIY